MEISATFESIAYIGPGAGLSLGGALLGLLLAFLTALGFTLLWPIRTLYRKIRARRTQPVRVRTKPAPSETNPS